MTWFQLMSASWHKDDVNMLNSQAPSNADFCNAVFDIEIEAYMSKRKWNKFAGLINEAFSLVEYSGTFNITVQLNAVNYGSEHSVIKRLDKLKCVMDYRPPVPAFPGWTIVLQFKKFPYTNQLEKTMATIERAVYGVRYPELAYQKETEIY